MRCRTFMEHSLSRIALWNTACIVATQRFPFKDLKGLEKNFYNRWLITFEYWFFRGDSRSLFDVCSPFRPQRDGSWCLWHKSPYAGISFSIQFYPTMVHKFIQMYVVFFITNWAIRNPYLINIIVVTIKQ